MKSKTLLWLIPLILLLLLIPLAVPSALPAAGAEDLPLWETVELANPHPGPVPLDEKPPFAPDEAGWLPDEQGYVDGTIAVRLEKRVVNNTKVYITFVQIADPSQLRTASYKPYPQQAEIRATKLASREKAVVALNADWFVSNGGFGITGHIAIVEGIYSRNDGTGRKYRTGGRSGGGRRKWQSRMIGSTG